MIVLGSNIWSQTIEKKTPSWNVGIFRAMEQPQYEPCFSYQHRKFLQLNISELVWSLCSDCHPLRHGYPTKSTRGWEDQHVSNHFRVVADTPGSSAWQQHFCRWRRSIATGNDVEQSNSALWKFPQGPPGPFVSFRFHGIWETPCLVHLKVQDE